MPGSAAPCWPRATPAPPGPPCCPATWARATAPTGPSPGSPGPTPTRPRPTTRPCAPPWPPGASRPSPASDVPEASGRAGQAERGSTLELFFDLVFVFTITQLTAVLSDDPTLRGLLRVVLMLGVIYWMYGGYAWLTNAVATDRSARRVLLPGGQGGFPGPGPG